MKLQQTTVDDSGAISEKNGIVSMDKNFAGPLFMLSAALLFTIMSILVKQMDPRYSVWHIGFFRFAGGAVILLALFGRHGNIYKGNNIPLLIIRGCTGSIAFIAAVTAIRILPISTGVVIFYSFPVFAAIFAAIIYREKIGIPQIICMLLVMTGIAVLFDFNLAGKLFGQCMALLAGAFAGLTVTLIRSLRENNGPAVIYLYFCTMGAVVTLPMFINSPVTPATPVEWVMIWGMILTSLTAQLLMNQGFFYCRGWEGGVYMSSETIFTSIAGIVFLKDPISWRFWFGSALILGCGIAMNWLKSRQ
ncbi:putative permease of the drug/metabolite transporter superfamily [Desulfamplus magnetovallimortis]|uniref:Putative permease of the drug/metabolite transporter superfamily n=1 Tax=Desulfamplus magnetovallimortis TaxID=1246637 RepID=A0A1W1HA38_9BACT|nr:DMT family transporter [Desulfamplus magnetovallimortis]SLM29341.1 putative permease of the drug/metabolite transporter superfamily [Desulfamplus magnetovallimortis]